MPALEGSKQISKWPQSMKQIHAEPQTEGGTAAGCSGADAFEYDRWSRQSQPTHHRGRRGKRANKPARTEKGRHATANLLRRGSSRLSDPSVHGRRWARPQHGEICHAEPTSKHGGTREDDPFRHSGTPTTASGFYKNTVHPIRRASRSAATVPRAEFPCSLSPGDQIATEASPGTMTRIPPPTPLFPGSPTRQANSPEPL